jgi:hypothetical protein
MYLSEEGIRSQFSAGCEITVGDIFTFIYQEEYNLIYGWTLYSLQSTCFDTAVEELAR